MPSRGLFYRYPFAHRLDEYWKSAYHTLKCGTFIAPSFRFREAARHVDPGMSVLDVCCGTCQLRAHLPDDSRYTGVDGSAGFANHARAKGIDFMESEITPATSFPETDCAIMIVSLYQFGDRAGALLETLKRTSRRVVIVEDVLSMFIARGKSGERGWLASLYDHLVAGAGGEKHAIFSAREIKELFSSSGFGYIDMPNPAYVVGVYDREGYRGGRS